MVQSQFQTKKNNGFTLLELLIVLGIVVILAVVVIIVVNPAELLKKSRDVQRLSDLATIKKALSLYVTTVNNADLDTSVENFCFAPSNGYARIAYSYNGALANCNATITEGADVTTGSVFSGSNFCFSRGMYDIVQDFSTISNPAPGGIWSYGTKSSATSATLVLQTTPRVDPCTTGGPMPGWTDSGGTVAIQKVFGSTCSIPAGSFSLPPEKIRMFWWPSPTNSTVRWTAPKAGTYTIVGTFLWGGAGSWTSRIVHNTTQIFSGTSNVSNQTIPFSLTRTVAQGDTIDVVGPSGNIGYTEIITPSSGSDELVKAIDGTGWIPVNFTAIPGGSPLQALPVDPINTISNTSAPASTDHVYRYVCQQSSTGGKPFRVFELNAQLESDAYTQAENKLANDGGDNDNYYEIGTSLRLLGAGTNF